AYAVTSMDAPRDGAGALPPCGVHASAAATSATSARLRQPGRVTGEEIPHVARQRDHAMVAVQRHKHSARGSERLTCVGIPDHIVERHGARRHSADDGLHAYHVIVTRG